MKIPRNIRRLRIKHKKLLDNFIEGTYLSLFKGRGIEFDEAREYTEKDDTRFIDWNITARMGRPYTKTYKEERELKILFLCDLSFSMQVDNRIMDSMTDFVSLLGFSAAVNGDRTGAVLFDRSILARIPFKKGLNHLFSILRKLQTQKAEYRGSELVPALKLAQEMMKKRGVIFILSDFLHQGFEKDLYRMARKHEVYLVYLHHDYSEFSRKSIMLPLIDPETRRTMILTPFLTKYRKRWQDYWKSRIQKVKGLRSKGRVKIIEIHPGEDILKSLQAVITK